MSENEEKNNYKKPKSKKRVALTIAVFLLCVCLIFTYMSHVFSMGAADANRQNFNAFYSEEEDTIDVMFLGTSAINRYFVNPIAYEEEGLSTFTLATMGMPMFFMPILMDEVEKTQDPSLYVIELRWTYKTKDQITDAHIRRVTDNLRNLKVRSEAIDTAFEFMDGETGLNDDITFNKLEYMVPLIKYHARLAEENMTGEDFYLESPQNETKGYVLSDNTITQVNQFETELTSEEEPLEEDVEEVLDELLDYCDELPDDKEVLFILSPFSVPKEKMTKFNTAIDIVEDRGYTVVNFNTEEMYEELDVDWEHDFYNSMHFNYLGAEKFTEWLTEYIADNYDLVDHRGDSKYDSWHEAYEVYQDWIKDGITTIGYKYKDKDGKSVVEWPED